MIKIDGFKLKDSGGLIMQGYCDINGWLTKKKLRKTKGDKYNKFCQVIVRVSLEVCYAMAHFLLSSIHNSVKMIFDKLDTPLKAL